MFPISPPTEVVNLFEFLVWALEAGNVFLHPLSGVGVGDGGGYQFCVILAERVGVFSESVITVELWRVGDSVQWNGENGEAENRRGIFHW